VSGECSHAIPVYICYKLQNTDKHANLTHHLYISPVCYWTQGCQVNVIILYLPKQNKQNLNTAYFVLCSLKTLFLS